MFELSVGSKVFLLGEYQVLQEGTAFLAVLEPRFKMNVKAGAGELKGVPEGSPASLYHQQENEFFKNWNLEFLDPHLGRGGFGASTAQIALLQGFKEGFKSISSHSQVELDLKKIHQKYLELVRPSSGPSPSGADLISQLQGGLVELNIKSGKIQKHAWPFSDLQVYFFVTGKKQVTHEHLKGLTNLTSDSKDVLSGLSQEYQKAMHSFYQSDVKPFVQAIADYQNELNKMGWVTPETLAWLSEIQKIEGVLAAKGCGAMGADVIAVVGKTSYGKDIINCCEKLGLSYLGSLEQRTEGFAFEWTAEQTARSLSKV